MRVAAHTLRVGDWICTPRFGTTEIAEIRESGGQLWTWVRGRRDQGEPHLRFDRQSMIELVRPASVAPAPARRGRKPNRVKQAAKLRYMADTIERHTRRDAGRLAGVARARAYGDATTSLALRRAAVQVERGALEYMARLSNREQLRDLALVLLAARHRREQHDPSIEGPRLDLGDVPFVQHQGLVVSAHELRELGRVASPFITAEVRQELRRLVAVGERIELSGEDVAVVRRMLATLRQNRIESYTAERIAIGLRRLDRLARLGIRDTASLQAALREYLGCCFGQVEVSQDVWLLTREAAESVAAPAELGPIEVGEESRSRPRLALRQPSTRVVDLRLPTLPASGAARGSPPPKPAA